MENNENNIPHNLYDEQLTTINGLKFTHREIDIITAIIHMRGAGKIASLLSISTRTVETHTANTMRKMDVNSREGIIDFVERAGHAPWINTHYRNLLVQSEFKKLLREVFRLVHNKSIVCTIVYENEDEEAGHILPSLKEHLSLCGIKVIPQKTSGENTIAHSIVGEKFSSEAPYVYIIPPRFIEQFQRDRKKQYLELSSLTHNILPNTNFLTLLLHEKDNTEIPRQFLDLGYVGIGGQHDYYSSFFNILRRVLPDTNLDKFISEFMKSRESTPDNSENNLTHTWSPSKTEKKKRSILKGKLFWFVIVNAILILSFAIGLFISKQYKSNLRILTDAKSPPSIRSDLVVPTDNTFLNRPKIISKLEESLKDNGGIQTVALVGIGGAGKTTIARRYALQQKVNVVWEINAATRDNLKDSFERLAYALCKTEEEKKILVGLQNIKNKIERDEKILLFVKEKLKSVSNWFLIYDNVEKFTDIQKYFPCDSTVWGKGKIIVTTSDSNTKNNSLIHNFIQIGELSPQDKLNLFTKIMTNENATRFTPKQEEEAHKFLTDVPPFPLDVSIAAYYLKSTHTPYAKYLERLKENSNDFETIQTNVVKEASDYTKTRYRIVTLSLKQLIDTHKDFGDLLLLISLLDSQNIPNTLLSNYKSDVVVDNFIYNLKKYSLVTSETASNSIPTLSIHRKTQEISLIYLIKAFTLSENSPLLHSIAATIEDYIAQAIDREDFSRMKLLVTHCERILNHDHLLTDPMKSSIGGELGCIYYYLRHYHKAKQLLEENLVNLKKYYGENHLKIARILVYNGNFYRVLGDYEKAKILLQQSLVIYKKHPDQAGSARSLGYLGVVYRDLGNFQEAKDLLEQSLAIHEKYSKNLIGHAWVLAHLGNVNMILGDYEKAKVLLEQSLIIYKKHSEDYVGVAWVLGYLGTVYKLLGNYDMARNLLEQSLLIIRKYFSDDHIYVASGLASLASVYTETGDYQKAKSLLKDSLTVYEMNYGKNHIETARVLRMLGEAFCVEGDMETSEDLINKSLLVFQQKNYPESFKSYESLATLYLKRANQARSEGDIKQAKYFYTHAVHYLKEALEIVRGCFSEDSVHITKIQSLLNSLETPTAE